MIKGIFDKVTAVRISEDVQCGDLDISEENKALRSEIFAVYHRLQDTEDRMAAQEALIALTDSEKHAKICMAENDLSMYKALVTELHRQNATYEYKIHEYERLNMKASVEHVQLTALQKEIDKLKDSNTSLESAIAKQKEDIVELNAITSDLKIELSNSSTSAGRLLLEKNVAILALEKLTIEHHGISKAFTIVQHYYLSTNHSTDYPYSARGYIGAAQGRIGSIQDSACQQCLARSDSRGRNSFWKIRATSFGSKVFVSRQGGSKAQESYEQAAVFARSLAYNQ
jgi:hypothetical protein